MEYIQLTQEKFTEGAHLLQYDREKRGSQRHG